jgi:hypothetical protein
MALTAESIEGAPRGSVGRKFHPCRTVLEVFEAVGGKHAMCELTKTNFTTVCNWLSLYRKIPPRWYVRIQGELKRRGYIADPALFGME